MGGGRVPHPGSAAGPIFHFLLPASHFLLPPPAFPSTQTHQQQHGAITRGLTTAGPQPASRRAGVSSLLGPELMLPFSVPPALCTQAALPALFPVDVAAVVPGLLHSRLTAPSMEDPVATCADPVGAQQFLSSDTSSPRSDFPRLLLHCTLFEGKTGTPGTDSYTNITGNQQRLHRTCT